VAWRHAEARVTVTGASTLGVQRITDSLRASSAVMRVVGAGSWLDAGRPVDGRAERLALNDCAGVVEYEPGDLVITVGAATTLAEVDAATAPHAQWIGLDPFGAETGTVGATIATASLGPLSTAYGAPRDQLLGLQYVTGDGTIARAGGRVVKNVAGFDVARVQCGAWGTLGVITEVSLRCFARPAVDRTIAIPLPIDPHSVIETLRSSRVAPIARVIIDATVARDLGLEARAHALVRLGGNAAAVAAQQAVCTTLGAMIDRPAACWHTVRAMDGAASLCARVSAAPASLARTWSHVEQALQRAGLAPEQIRRVAIADRGIVRIAVSDIDDTRVAQLMPQLAPEGGAVQWERLPASCWSAAPSPLSDPLAARVRMAFDPSARLNRGILGSTQT
jgi:glycolate oxidase FAD binding subunit